MKYLKANTKNILDNSEEGIFNRKLQKIYESKVDEKTPYYCDIYKEEKERLINDIFQRGMFYLIEGASGIGKTSMIEDIYLNLKNNKHNVAFISLFKNTKDPIESFYNQFECKDDNEFLKLIKYNYRISQKPLIIIIDNIQILFEKCDRNQIKDMFRLLAFLSDLQGVKILTISSKFSCYKKMKSLSGTFERRVVLFPLKEHPEEFKHYIRERYKNVPAIINSVEEIYNLIGQNFGRLNNFGEYLKCNPDDTVEEYVKSNSLDLFESFKTNPTYQKLLKCSLKDLMDERNEKCLLTQKEIEESIQDNIIRRNNYNIEYYDKFRESQIEYIKKIYK